MKHYRMTITELLLQTEWWQCQDGMPIRLEDMEPSHRYNTLAWLFRRSRMLYRHYLWHFAGTEIEKLSVRMHNELTQTTDKWLAQQPLVIELVRMIRIDDSMEGEVVAEHTELMEKLALSPSDMSLSLEAKNKT